METLGCSEGAHLPPARVSAGEGCRTFNALKGHFPEGACLFMIRWCFGSFLRGGPFRVSRVTSFCSSQVTFERKGGSDFFSEREEGWGKGASDSLWAGKMGAPWFSSFWFFQLFVSEATLQLPSTTWFAWLTWQHIREWWVSWGRAKAVPTPKSVVTVPRWVEKAELSQPWLSGAQTPKGGCYPLEFGPRKVVSSIQRRSVLWTVRLGFHKVTGFLVASDVLEPKPCDFPAGDVGYPTPTFTGESSFRFSDSSFSPPPLCLSRFISL